ncbi:DNA-directed RNA polymerase subunit omega [Clostridium pasteurianum DSM 525 = ATCC 6013]|uniref:DNA-directed RNA polymerase subunit omega n=1 Tax=Clostridium pasteurianum DSM 525 = ATCC 6013 TaxID=1262449 RepID=A0A0H3J8E2_CLOPA|nr:DNA-directed RNA polymerase subunit omega [Clostridium pasteurianum]AJA48178.1 DNA-directed RNA polymerase subunit omega [Clostridium pasteurianum DSM 525 = ATCC 6013]AJA52166.1 DNA-directed RNA polymerase subunit omega [Clostridium pasteurianum DSM 525 = ATCC 6013]AOZ75437.1 DNA-directed RNA polymerase subunit omega [Clostridium pasteurianum DSM 525 = ATCC 6013]AOZ79232.1 DNA-directed RNA polymerase subunit omega [Clostridium pasteurianum]ELP60670.1 DNA-directed RNA polymerase subunit omeg
MNNSMINPSIVDLVKKAGDRYSVVVITSKRARQIISGSKPLVDIDANKPLTIAINELDQDKFQYDTEKEGSK